jgi:hypothetical protein
MTAYEAGFDAGERAAFADRRKGRVRCRPQATPDQRVLEWYLLTVVIILVAWSALGAFALWVTGGL